MSKKHKTQWFVECLGNPVLSSECLVRALARAGISEAQAQCQSVQEGNGSRHTVWRIPKNFVKKFRSSKMKYRRFGFRFWKRKGSKRKISPVDFVGVFMDRASPLPPFPKGSCESRVLHGAQKKLRRLRKNVVSKDHAIVCYD